MEDFKVLTAGYLNVHISTSKNDISFNERRFPKDITVSELKVRNCPFLPKTNLDVSLLVR